MKKPLVAAITTLAASLVAASGAIVTETATFSGKQIGDPTFTVSLDKFNASLGTLTAISFAIQTQTSSTSLTFDNEGSAGTAAFKLDTQVHAQTGINLLSDAYSNSTVSANGTVAADNDAAANFSGTDSLSLIGGATSSGSIVRTSASPGGNYIAQFSAPHGGNPYLVRISSAFTSASALTSASSGVSGVFNSPSQALSGSIVVKYTYTPLAAVPEAGTVLFGAAIALGLAFRRTRPVLS